MLYKVKIHYNKRVVPVGTFSSVDSAKAYCKLVHPNVWINTNNSAQGINHYISIELTLRGLILQLTKCVLFILLIGCMIWAVKG